jgi:hypothetical protein
MSLRHRASRSLGFACRARLHTIRASTASVAPSAMIAYCMISPFVPAAHIIGRRPQQAEACGYGSRRFLAQSTDSRVLVSGICGSCKKPV